MNRRAWIEAMRLRTLPVSVAGVVAALGYARLWRCVDVAVFVLCLAFAVIAQIASNFANEYYDYRRGLDRPGRQGPRRGVTEGDITPAAMLRATIALMALAAVIGLVLMLWGGWIILAPGLLIVAGVIAYSAGPFPLSHRCLGEVAVIAFFGLAPVCLTFYLMKGYIFANVIAGGLAIGLMGANVLLVNNIRDRADDRAVRKYTLAVVGGRRLASFLYLANGWLAVWLMGSAWLWLGAAWTAVPAAYLLLHTLLWLRVDTLSRRAARHPDTAHSLNRLLGMTAALMAAYALLFALAA